MGRILFVSLTPTSLVATAFLATSLVAAHAAELPVKAPPPPAYYDWTGPYLGVNLGGSWGHQSSDLYDEAGESLWGVRSHPDGVIGGGQIGFNWQFPYSNGWGWGLPWGNAWVVGLEADIQGSSERSTEGFGFLVPTPPLIPPTSISGSFGDKLEWFGTVRGRVGIAFDRIFPYVTGGWAVGDRKFNGEVTADGIVTPFSLSSDMTKGWTVGGGVEWAFWDHWTAKFEYLYIEFNNNNNNNNNTFGPLAPPLTPFGIMTNHFTDNVARAGLNYKF